MEISAQMVKELREKTGAGFMDCKAALAEAGGDFEQAQVILRKRGVALAEKKSARAANDGIIASHLAEGGRLGVLVEVNCETDFVAKNPEFRQLATDIARLVAERAPSQVRAEDGRSGAALYDLELAGSGTVSEVLKAAVAKFGENMAVRRFQRLAAPPEGVLGSYVHAGGKIGVLVALRAPSGAVESVRGLARDLAMHVCAANPSYVAPGDIPAAVVEREREIARDQMASSGKPPAVIEKIIDGKLKKFYSEVCLVEQPYVRDESKTVGALLAEQGQKLGGPLQVERFVRYQLGGEGERGA
jgi:elongation factor Ts